MSPTLRRLALATLFGLSLAACASGPAPVAAPPEERRLERPANQPPPAAGRVDPGEAALAESVGDGVVIAPEPEDGDIIVPGQVERPVEPIPGTDPRTPAQRAEDRRAWDRCVTAAQRRFSDSGPGVANPVNDSPDEYCAERLGMAGRDAIPESRSR